MKRLTEKDVTLFQRAVYGFFRHGRRNFPWRRTNNPYHILVSEIMLQQTQAPRVVEKYKSFIKKFPSVAKLAVAPTRVVLKEWSGLGYNRRALMLQQAARMIVHDHRGVVPRKVDELKKLRGVGEYTAKAVSVFAFNQPEVLIETNVRSVFIHHFFPKRKKVSDKELLPLIAQTVDIKNPRQWYSALMDYGTHLKKEHGNPSRKSLHYIRQKAFIGSDRQVRGAIVRLLTKKRSATERELLALDDDLVRVKSNIRKLINEGLIKKGKMRYTI